MPNTVVSIFLFSFASLAIIHELALRFYLYWRHPWFDIPMHFFGGIVVALGVYTARELKLPFFKRTITFPFVLAFVLFAAFIWELFELMGGISVIQINFMFDTALDLILGLLGGVVGYVVGGSIKQLDA